MSKAAKNVGEFKLYEVLGRGSFGQVYRAVNQITGEEVAVKMIPLWMLKAQPQLAEMLKKEMEALKLLSDVPQVLKVYKSFTTTSNKYIVYELCEGGSLQKRLRIQGGLPEWEALHLLKEIALAIQDLTKHDILHRDIKTDNVLFKNGQLILGDFGLCQIGSAAEEPGFFGSPSFMAPEVLEKGLHSHKSEVYSMGVLFFEMLTGRFLFKESSLAGLLEAKKGFVLEGKEESRDISPKARWLLEKMLEPQPEKRITIIEILQTLDQEIRPSVDFILKSQFYSHLSHTDPYSQFQPKADSLESVEWDVKKGENTQETQYRPEESLNLVSQEPAGFSSFNFAEESPTIGLSSILSPATYEKSEIKDSMTFFASSGSISIISPDSQKVSASSPSAEDYSLILSGYSSEVACFESDRKCSIDRNNNGPFVLDMVIESLSPPSSANTENSTSNGVSPVHPPLRELKVSHKGSSLEQKQEEAALSIANSLQETVRHCIDTLFPIEALQGLVFAMLSKKLQVLAQLSLNPFASYYSAIQIKKISAEISEFQNEALRDSKNRLFDQRDSDYKEKLDESLEQIARTVRSPLECPKIEELQAIFEFLWSCVTENEEKKAKKTCLGPSLRENIMICCQWLKQESCF